MTTAGGWILAAALLAGLGGAVAAWRGERRARREAERQNEVICRINAVLEHQLTAHTEELRAAVALAEAASRAKGDFLANMSHEMRTPLNAVIGLTDVVLRTELSEFQRNHLRTVQESGDALLHVINDVLDFSKIEAGKLQIESVPFDLEDVVCDALKLLAIRAQTKGLELSCYVDPKAPQVIHGDPSRLRQVLVNLVNNAVTYTERGEVFVRVTWELEAERLHVAVLDSGIGIPPEHLQRVFESFQQADSSSTRRYGGTGLGLSISRELVRLMGGEIRAESEPGVGSAFSFTLTVHAEPRSSERLQRHALWRSTLDGQRVLIVDDNATNRTLLAELVRGVGMQPVQAAHASAALDELCKSEAEGAPIELVVSDVGMPGEDGFRLAERIRGHPEIADARIVLLTSALDAGNPGRCARIGISARLMKPVKHSELLDALVAALRREAADVAGDATRTAQHSARSAASRRILLVEDSLPNQKLALAILEEEGHQVVVACNGREALEHVRHERFDLVLMDVQMPEMDGYQATAAIRDSETDTDGHLPIVAMTANAMAGDRERCLLAGMDDYIAKPVRRGELLRRVAELGRKGES